MKKELHITIETENKTAVDILSTELSSLDLSRQSIKQAMQKGCTWLESSNQKGQKFIRRLRRAKKTLLKGDILHCYYDSDVLATEPTNATLVSDEGDYSVWNKPAGMLSQGSKWGDHCTINRWVEKNIKPERPAFIVHRLDRAANGLIILAHKKQVASQFSQMFKNHEIQKHYEVLVNGDFKASLNTAEETKTINDDIDGKTAISHISLMKYDPSAKESLLDVQIETGRKHQIRKHLSKLGYPVIGDRMYGIALSKNTSVDLQLKAMSLSFICPIVKINKEYFI